MTPRATASPLGGAVSGKDLPAVPANVSSGGSGALFLAALASLRLDPATTATTAATASSVLLAASAPEESAGAAAAVAVTASTAAPVPVPPAEPGSKASPARRAQVTLTSVLQQLRTKPPAPGTPHATLTKLPATEPIGSSAQSAEVNAPGSGKDKSASAVKRAAVTKDGASAEGAVTSVAGAVALLATLRPPLSDAPVATSPGRGKSQSAPAGLADNGVMLVSASAPKAAAQPDLADSGQPVPADATATASLISAPLDVPARSSAAGLANLVSDFAVRSQSRGGAQPGDGGSTAADNSTLASQAINGLTGAVQSAPGTTVQSVVPATAQSIAVPVADRQWAHAVATRVLVLAGQKIESATLHVNPEYLGPIDVHIDMRSSHVNVSFGAAHLDTRTALELALPQLRQVLAGAGLTLGEATVQQQLRRESQNAPTAARSADHAADSDVELVHQARRQLTLIDEYV